MNSFASRCRSATGGLGILNSVDAGYSEPPRYLVRPLGRSLTAAAAIRMNPTTQTSRGSDSVGKPLQSTGSTPSTHGGLDV